MAAEVKLDPLDAEIARLRAALAEAEAALTREVNARKRSDAQRLSEDKLLAQMNEAQRLSKSGSYTADLARDEHFWSDELYRIFGFEPGTERTTARAVELVHPEDLPVFQAAFERATRGMDSDFVFRIITPQGVVKYLRAIGKVEPKADGDYELIGGIQDVTESKLAENALKTSEAELRRVLAQLNEAQRLSKTGSSTSDLETDEHVWSDELYRITGFEPGSKVDTQRYFELVHPDDREALSASMQSALNGETDSADIMIRFVTSTGLKHVRLVASRRTEFGGRPIFVGAVQDVTEAALAKEALAASERLLTQTIDTIPVNVSCIGLHGEIKFSNRPWLDYIGLSAEQARDVGWRAVVHPDDVDAVGDAWRKMWTTGVGAEHEMRVRRFDGEYRWFLLRTAPFRDESGTIMRWYGTYTDIDDRKRAEAELRRVFAQLNEAQHLSRTGSFTTDMVTGEAVWSDELCRIFDLEPGTKMTVPEFLAFVHPGDAPFMRAATEAASRGNFSDVTFRVITAKGATKHLRAFAKAFAKSEGHFLITGAIQDITPYKLTEDALRRSEAVLAHGEAASETGSFLWKLDTNEVRWSDQLHRIYGFELGSTVTLERIVERVHPQDIPLMRDMTRRAHTGLDSEFEHRMLMPNGSVKYLHFVARSIRDPDGRLEYMGSVQDITNRKLAEQEHDRVRSELTHAARALSLGVLTASLAHEVNQPLAGIITNASTCVRMLSTDPPNVTGAQRTARRTVRDGKRASEVVKRLRALFAKKAFAVESVDLTDATREVLALSANELRRHHVNVSTELEGEIEVAGDRVQIQQVILNLVLNACDAVKDVEDRPRSIVVRTGKDDAGSGYVAVRDSGVGINSEALGKVFDAFYTTKPDGMGIGLSISRSIVERHNGRLWAEPNDGPGTTFSFSIPAKDRSA